MSDLKSDGAMIPEYIKAVQELQELFQELATRAKVSPEQASRFDQSQRVLVNFHAWIQNQLEGNLKVTLPWDDPRFADAWKLWTSYKKQQFRYSYRPIGEQGALKDLADLSGGDMDKAIAIIHQSIKKGWRGFFEIKGQTPITKKLVEAQNIDYKQKLFNRLTQKS
jgi:hypothetical protein